MRFDSAHGGDRFSIVTPTFNAGTILRQCHLSIADQGDFVSHLVQDGNSENREGLTALAATTADLRSEPDSGMYQALNRGFARATGTIFGHLNADEQYLPEVVARVTKIFERHPKVEVVCGDMILTDADWQPLAYRRSVKPPKNSAGKIPLSVPTCAMFFRRSVFDRGLRYPPDLRAIGDAVFIAEILEGGSQWYFDPVPYAAFSLHDTNLSNSGAAEDDRDKLGIKQSPAQKAFLRCQVWVRRLRAGAYRRRFVTIRVFTDECREVRAEKSAWVDWKWPCKK